MKDEGCTNIKRINMKHEIKKILSMGINKRNNNENIIEICKSNIKIIYSEKGGICSYCRTWFKILSSLLEHQSKCHNK